MGDEQARVETVRAEIVKQINALTGDLLSKRGGIEESRREMWAETHLIRDFDDLLNLSSLLPGMEINERMYAGVSLRLNNLRRMLDSPYFGRIDFTEDGYSDLEEIYIGGQSLFDEAKQCFYVYDWRAPISSMYYDYGVGRASFAAPDGEISGEVSLKRQYRIEKGELVYFFDSDLKIDDEILQQELSKVSDAKIKTIINTIQREQNRAIRSEADNMLVFGPAGSGKTSVGLHRLAYLLYRHRGKLTSARVRIFSTNNIFATYIAGVIPELGEEDVVTLDIQTLMRGSATERNFQSPYAQIEYLSKSKPGDARRRGIALKYSAGFLAFLAEFIRRYRPSAFEDARFLDTVLCGAEQMEYLYADRTSVGNLSTKTARVLDYVNRCFETHFKDNKREITAFFNELDDENYNDGEIRAKFDEQKNMAISDLRARLLPGAAKLYEKALRAYIKEKGGDQDVLRGTLSALRYEKIHFEDALVMFYIDILTGRVKKDRSVRHILVDEAQDLSRLQHLILGNIFEGCHFTVLADVNQALYPDINLHDVNDLVDLYPGAEVTRLSKSYRSTFEINRFASRLIGVEDDSTFYQRYGGEPEILESGDAALTAAEIIQSLPNAFNTVGVLLSDAEKAAAFHERLANAQNNLSAHGAAGRQPLLIKDADDGFRPGVLVMAVPFAKGLEFDAVIAPEYGGEVFEGEWGRKLLYLICTRALHRLYLIK